MISAEGARNHGLLNVPTDEFFDTYHYITENEVEQEFIDSVDEGTTSENENGENRPYKKRYDGKGKRYFGKNKRRNNSEK